MFYFLVVLTGFVSAFTGSIAGLGGGIILVPTLLLLHQSMESFYWATPQSIVGISLVVMVFTALSSSISYFKSKRIDYKSGSIFLIGSIPGGMIGAYVNQFVSGNVFSLYFGLLMIVTSFMFFLKKKTARSSLAGDKWNIQREAVISEKKFYYSFSLVGAFSIALFVGILSGLFGIGGGSLMVPAMILLFGFPVHIATATSMFMILFLSLVSSTTHIMLGHVPWEYVWLFVPGAWLGGTAGAKLNQMLKGTTLEWILRSLLIVIGVRLIWQGIG